MYDRDAAVKYARKWALSRNPDYYNFDAIGGDCTNFVSQCLCAGGVAMRHDWYYYSLSDRAPAWTSVEFLYEFLMRSGIGSLTTVKDAASGDIFQLSQSGERFTHSGILLHTHGSLTTTLIAAHTYDALDRPLDTYIYKKLRLIKITDN